MPRPIVLASTSPYRKQLLLRLQIPFDCANPETDETPVAGEPADCRALRLAEEKSAALAGEYGDALILGGDQTIADGDDCFDKPNTVENAVRQLRQMRGRALRFHTAVALTDSATGRTRSRLTTHTVRLRMLSDAEIDRYVAKEPALNCAGGAQIEGLGISLAETIEGGDPTALVGMSLIDAAALLRAHGVDIP